MNKGQDEQKHNQYNKSSRTVSSAKNMVFAVLGQISKELLAFIVRTVFIRMLAVEYLGVNGLFTNILSFLSLAEMGIGSALVFAMYKPMADHDEVKLQQLMGVYKTAYRIVGCAVLVIGFSLTPFLDFFIKDKPDLPDLELIYILYVINTGSTYFFAYKGSIFNADQRAYVVTNNTTLFTLIQSIARIAILATTRNFIAYLSVSILVVYIQNFNISRLADKQYPFIKNKPKTKLPSGEVKQLLSNIGALTVHRIGAVILNSSDNIIISKYIGLIVVGLYSNYSMIVNAISVTFDMVFNAFTTSVGNLCAREPAEKIYRVFNALLLLNIWIISFCVISLYNLLNPFIEIWLGKEFLLSNGVILALVFSLFMQQSIKVCDIFRTASGLFKQYILFPVAQCAVNIGVSIILVHKIGLGGVFLGTAIAIITTRFWVTPKVFFKLKLKMPVYLYYVKYSMFTVVGIVAFLATSIAVDLIPYGGLAGLLVSLACCCVIPNLIFLIVFFKSQEFSYILWLVKLIVRKQN